jgi:hypothetical protein
VFYGALDADTCLAEIRAPVGASVIVGSFRPLRPLCVVDLKAMERVYQNKSMFDPNFQIDGERCQFLRSLSRRLSFPVMPSDEQLDYVVTQVICEYLATLSPQLDGILYPSTQSGGGKTNIVLFSHASRVQKSSLPNGTKTEIHVDQCSDDDEDIEITITHTIPKLDDASSASPNKNSTDDLMDFGFGGWVPSDVAKQELREADPTLVLIEGSLQVMDIKGIEYKTEKVPVRLSIHDLKEQSSDFDF